MFKNTNEQEKIWNVIENTDKHVIVYAGAGTGKTYTIVEGANRCSGSKMFLAFNKSIATELDKKLPHDCEAKTFHALGLKAVKAQNRRAKVDNRKTRNIVNNVLGKNYKSTNQLCKLISLLKGSLSDWDDREQINALVDEYDIEFDGIRDFNDALQAMKTIYNNSTDVSILDFDDMIWLPLIHNMPMQHYDNVFVDEAQDFNEAQRELVLRTCNGGRLVIVGDPNQAIYGFRGADSNSMDIMLQKMMAKDSKRIIERLTLSTTFRCPKTVVADAQRFQENYNCPDDAIDGAVNVHAAFTPELGDLVLCRVNAPLVGECFRLIASGVPAKVLGRDIGVSLEALVKKVTKDMDMEIHMFKPLLEEYVENLIVALTNAEKDRQIQSLKDKYECIVHLMSRNTLTVGGLIKNIKTIFGDKEKNSVIFSTVHKAKGLEADNVWILSPEKMPHPMAKSAADREQERNICYVAITRAKKNLNYVGKRIG